MTDAGRMPSPNDRAFAAQACRVARRQGPPPPQAAHELLFTSHVWHKRPCPMYLSVVPVITVPFLSWRNSFYAQSESRPQQITQSQATQVNNDVINSARSIEDPPALPGIPHHVCDEAHLINGRGCHIYRGCEQRVWHFNYRVPSLFLVVIKITIPYFSREDSRSPGTPLPTPSTHTGSTRRARATPNTRE